MIQPRKKRFPAGSVCKPCWELRYCPYGPLVEQFPLSPPEPAPPPAHDHYHEALDNLRSGRLRTEDEVWSEVDRLLYLDPSKWSLLADYEASELECRIWGHWCPVFWTQSGATETRVARRQGRYIPREIMLRVVRRDDQMCQVCFTYVPDNEIEFDHIIPVSRGGPTTIENLRVLCQRCNRTRSNDTAELLK